MKSTALECPGQWGPGPGWTSGTHRVLSLGRLILRDAVLSWPCVVCMACLLLHLYPGICKMPTLVDFDTLIPGLARELFSVGASHTGTIHLSRKRNKMTSEAAQRLNPTTALVPIPTRTQEASACQVARGLHACVPASYHLLVQRKWF